MKTKIIIIIALALLAFINFSIWSYVNNPLQLQPWTKTTMGVTFNPMRKHDTQKNNSFPSEAEIEQDIILLSDKVHAIRTYSVLKGLYKIPELAAKHGLNVTVGAWIDGDLEKNRQEIEALIQISRQNNPKIVRLMVGNEVMLRKDIPEEQLIEYLREVKKRTWRPVSTSETWDMWLAHPKLVEEVDFISVHILPFWEGIAAEDAVDYIFSRYYQLQQTYPKKPIVITEVGWPSDGQPFKHATASISNQAKFLREFLNRAAQEHLAYYIVEAFDQPWKMSIEGSAGAYWGIFNADRQAKYPMDGDVVTLPGWKHWATAAAVCSMVLMALFLFTRRSLKLPGILFFGLIANLAASTIFWSASIGAQQYQTKFTIVFWVILILMQVLAGIILLIESLEIAEVVWHKISPRT
ncbi:MAG: glycoside hydrolase family 17 protein, partial [Methylobacter sp.]